ncbi:hypothetical protein ACIQWR_21180 [Streptomyces sp. NPDC098789]
MRMRSAQDTAVLTLFLIAPHPAAGSAPVVPAGSVPPPAVPDAMGRR